MGMGRWRRGVEVVSNVSLFCSLFCGGLFICRVCVCVFLGRVDFGEIQGKNWANRVVCWAGKGGSQIGLKGR